MLALTRLVAASRVMVFRDPTLDDAGFEQFLKRFGVMTFTEEETPVDGAPDLNVVTKVASLTPAHSVFHTDTSCVDRPPAFTALRPVLYRHQWKAADGLIGDNQVRMHRADHENTLHDRVLHRGMVGGEVPLMA